jgi:glycine/D-amino acid oxidase-like deaminating enzyme
MDAVECLVIGLGVVGLAVARALARAGREVRDGDEGSDHKAFRRSTAGTRYAFARHNRCGVFFS